MPTFNTKPTPEYDQIRSKILSDNGLDPTKYDIDLDTGEAVEKPSFIQAAGTGALYNAPDAVVGGGAAALASKLPIPNPLAKLAVTVLAPMAAEWLANKAGFQEGKRSVLPESLNKSYDTSVQLNPTATQIGGVASGLAGGMRPSIVNIPKAASGIRTLVAGVPWARLPAAQSGALANVGIGVGLGAGIPAARQISSGEFNPTELAISGVGGALMTEPNWIGRRMGFHPTPAEDTGQTMPPPRDRGAYVPVEGQQLVPAYRDLMTRFANNQDIDMQYPDEVISKPQNIIDPDTGESTVIPPEEVRGSFTQSTNPLQRSLALIGDSTGLFDTPPHELLHSILNELKNGTPGEQALARRAIESVGGRFEDIGTPAGVEFEEALVEPSAHKFAGRFTPEGRESIIADLGSFIRDRFLGRGTRADYANILANVLQRQGARVERTGVVTGPNTSLNKKEKVQKPIDPGVLDIVRKMGFGEPTPELLAQINESLSLKSNIRSRRINQIDRQLQQIQSALELTPEGPNRDLLIQQRESLTARRHVYTKSEALIAKLQEYQLGSRTGEAPTQAPAKPLFNTENPDVTLSSFGPITAGEGEEVPLGYTKPVYPINKSAKDTIYPVTGEDPRSIDTTEGLDRLKDAEIKQRNLSRMRAEDFQRARAEEAAQEQFVDVNPEDIKAAIEQRQVRGPKTGSQYKELENVPGRELPQATEEGPEPSLRPLPDESFEQWRDRLAAEHEARQAAQQKQIGYPNYPEAKKAQGEYAAERTNEVPESSLKPELSAQEELGAYADDSQTRYSRKKDDKRLEFLRNMRAEAARRLSNAPVTQFNPGDTAYTPSGRPVKVLGHLTSRNNIPRVLVEATDANGEIYKSSIQGNLLYAEPPGPEVAAKSYLDAYKGDVAKAIAHAQRFNQPQEVIDSILDQQTRYSRRKKVRPEEQEESSGTIGQNNKALRKLVIAKQDSGDTLHVTGRELLQNSVDNLRSTYDSPEDRKVWRGSTKNYSENGLPTFFTLDNGSGMSPYFLIEKYMSLGTSAKEIGEGGGMGVAKAQIFGNAKEFEIRSTYKSKDGRKIQTIIHGTPEGFENIQDRTVPKNLYVGIDENVVPGIHIKIQEVPENSDTGTFVRTSYDKTEENLKNLWTSESSYTKASDYLDDVQFGYLDENYYSHNEKNSNLPNNINNSTAHLTESKYNTLHTINLPEATVEIKYDTSDRAEPKQAVKLDFLSAGLHQFYHEQFLKEKIPIPYNIIVDIKSKVSGNNKKYPFDLSRKKVTDNIRAKIQNFLAEFADIERQKILSKYKQAKERAPRFEHMPNLMALDVSEQVPEEVMNHLVHDARLVPVLTTAKTIQGAVSKTLSRLYPDNNFANYDFNGILTGSAEAYGVRFGATLPHSRGEIYLDPFLNFQRVLDEAPNTSDNAEIIERWFGKMIGTALHENLHQEIHDEGVLLARGLTEKLGDIVLDSHTTRAQLDKIGASNESLNSFFNTLKEWNETLTEHRNNTKSDAFIAEATESARSSESGGSDSTDQIYGTARYSRFGPKKKQTEEIKSRGLNPLAGEASKLERAGPDQAHLAQKFREVYDTRRAYNGKYLNPIIKAFEDLPINSRDKVYGVLIDEDRSKKSLRGQLNSAEQRSYDAIRSTIKQMASDQIAAGQPVWTRNGPRTRGVDPYYFPNVIDQGVRRILAEGQGTQAFNDLRNEYIQHQLNNRISQAEAEKRFEDLLGSFAMNPASNPAKFGGVRLPEGVGLPDSWIEKDPIRTARSYVNKFSRDRAFWDVMETDPDTMAMLGSDKYKGNQPLPSGNTKPNLIKDPQVQHLLSDFLGSNSLENEPIIKGASRLGVAALVGPLSKVADVSTVPFKALAYSPPGHGMTAVIKGLADWKGGFDRAFETGLNRRGGLIVLQDLLGFGEQVNSHLMKIAEGLTKYSGAEGLELVSRGLSQSIGEYIAGSWRTLAKTGNKNAIEFLDKLGITDTTPPTEAGTRIAQLLQGRYDATNLPAIATHGAMSPFFALQRWSVEQLNNFQRFAIEPAKSGNYWPAIMQILGGLAGGLAINEMRERITGRKNQTATWRELEEGRNKPGFADALTYKLLSATQVTGTIGVVSELTKQLYEACTKRNVQGINFPLLSIMSDITSRVTAAASAIADGQDAGKVITQAVSDVLKYNVQTYRLLRNALGKAGILEQPKKELTQANQNRDLQTWKRMEGRSLNASDIMRPSYSRLDEKEFDSAPIGEASKMVPKLISNAWKRSNSNPSEFSTRISQLGSIKTEGMPNPDTSPNESMQYYNWIKRTQGVEAANRLWQDYQKRSLENKMKRDMIPAFTYR